MTYEVRDVSVLFKADLEPKISGPESMFSTQPVLLPVSGPVPAAAVSASTGVGSAYDGADKMNLEMMRWQPALTSADGEILGSKETLDARGRDMVRNDPLVSSAVDLYRNGVVGTKMVLNAKPNGRSLGWDDDAVDAFQEESEALFEIFAHSDRCYVDAAQRMNLTDIVRLGVGGSVFSGEFLGTFEWFPDRPFRTAIQIIDPDRLSNPDWTMDTERLRGGVERDHYGSRVAYHIRTSHPGDYFGMGDGLAKWKRIPARKPWGRLMVLHVFEAMRVDQTRGVAKMVSALRQMRMTSKFSDVALQNAVIQATIAAVVETDLAPATIDRVLGADDVPGSIPDPLGQLNKAHLMNAMAFSKSGNVAKMNGAMIPYMPLGAKLNVKALGDGSLGTAFETSLIRKIAAALGVSHEELSKNLSEVSFAGIKAAMAQTFQQMQSVKRAIADKIATAIYRNWLEEVVGRGMITSLPNAAKRPEWIMNPLNLDALSACSWIGAARGTIDELNEVRAADLRYKMGITTMEYECSRLGLDWRDVQKQRRREAQYLGGNGAQPQSAPAPGTDQAQASADVQERLAAVEQFVEDAQNDQ